MSGRGRRGRALRPALLALLLLGCADGAGPPGPEPPPDLAFWDRDRNAVVGVRLAAPWSEVVIAEGAMNPAWSPDGRRIAVASCCDPEASSPRPTGIVVVDADGTGAVRLSDHGGRPSWSPGGSRVAFVGVQPGLTGIYVVGADGAAPTKVADMTTGSPWIAPSWSPDGTRLLAGGNGLFVIQADGSGVVTLAEGSVLTFEPTWSPDGTRILFERFIEGVIELFLVNVDGTDPVRLTESAPDYTRNTQYAWSPDGTRIAVVRAPVLAPVHTPDHNLYVMDADGGDLRRVAHYAGWPSWSPDGRLLAYVRNDRVRVVNLETGAELDLAAGTWPATWRPAPVDD